ncbi:MAG: hypothetical protein QM775_25575 [Pirellulales bacterium]
MKAGIEHPVFRGLAQFDRLAALAGDIDEQRKVLVAGVDHHELAEGLGGPLQRPAPR